MTSAIYAEFQTLLDQTTQMALATCTGARPESRAGTPNVRIINFCPDATRPHVLLFTTSRENAKVREFVQNPQVAFSTIPQGTIAHARSQFATVQRSALTLDVVQDAFIARIPHFAETVEVIGHELDVYEIHMESVSLILDYDRTETVRFSC